MTKRILYYSLFIIHYSLLSAPAETYILPARADLGFAMPTVSMPLGEYTNCVAFYTAAAPVFGEGTADYIIPDLSPARNDATQPGTGYQPTRIYTDGEWALSFDGVDDSADLGVIPDLNTCWTVYGRLRKIGISQLMGCQGGGYFWFGGASSGVWAFRNGGTIVRSDQPSDLEWHEFSLRPEGLYVDGACVAANTDTPNGPDYPIHLGNINNSGTAGVLATIEVIWSTVQ